MFISRYDKRSMEPSRRPSRRPTGDNEVNNPISGADEARGLINSLDIERGHIISDGRVNEDELRLVKVLERAIAFIERHATPAPAAPQEAECICPTCGIRHGGGNTNGGF